MMTKASLAKTAALAALALSGCNAQSSSGDISAGGSGICVPFKATDAGTTSGAEVEECLHRWTYALASAHESADAVAAAAVTACGAQISNWNQQALNPASPDAQGATSLVTGQPTNAMAEHAQFAQTRAQFYVVEARAGHCAAPPAKLLARNGA